MLEIFGNPVVVKHDILFDKYDQSSDFYLGIESLFNKLEPITNLDKSVPRFCPYGVTHNTHYTNICLSKSLNKFNNFFDDVLLEPLKECFSELDSDFKVSYAKLKYSWVVKYLKGVSGGIPHTHKNRCKYVAAFYYKADKNAADLVIVDKNYQCPEDRIDKNSKYNLKVSTGTLVCHKADLWHTMSDHDVDEDRICIVLELE